MSFTPPHFLHVYNRPKDQVTEGLIFQKRFQTYGYSHRIMAKGGFDTASCQVAVDKIEAEKIFTDYIGCHVRTYIDDPFIPAWEGYISRVTIETGGISATRSLDNMANVVDVVYSTTGASPQTVQTGIAFDAFSGALYGFKTQCFDIGAQYSAGAAMAAVYRDGKLAKLRFPPTSASTGGSESLNVTIEMKGFYHTWDWDTFGNTDTTSLNAGQVVFLFILDNTPTNPLSQTGYNASRWTANGNGNGVFYRDNDFSLWVNNTSFNLTTEKRNGETHWNKVLGIVEAGDGVDDWVIGITPTDPNLGYRRAYYREANTDVEYKTNAYIDRRFYSPYGTYIPSWRILPDRAVIIEDIVAVWIETLNDPRLAYIESVEYDAESGQVTWQSKDDVSLVGVFQVDRAGRSTGGQRFGAPQRNVFV